MFKSSLENLVPSDADVARYAAEMAAELKRLAEGRPKLKTLAYLLDMARLEGERQAMAARRTPVRRWPEAG